MKAAKNYKFWFCTGSQDLYGDECLRHVCKNSRRAECQWKTAL